MRVIVATIPPGVKSQIATEFMEVVNVSPYKGEATAKLAGEWIVAPGVRILYNARLSFLKNKETGHPLELDIFLPERD